jgi:hypothetical protein
LANVFVIVSIDVFLMWFDQWISMPPLTSMTAPVT